MSASAQQMSAEVEEMTAEAQELAVTADHLKTLVARFQLEDETAEAGRPATAGGILPHRRASDWGSRGIPGIKSQVVR